MTPFYYEADLEFSRPEWNEHHKGIVLAADEGEAWAKVMTHFERAGGEPNVAVKIFQTLGKQP